MDFSIPLSSPSEDEGDRKTKAEFREILDFHKNVNMKRVMRDWLDEKGYMIENNDDEVTEVVDESEEFFTSAFQAFNQGRNMPPRLQRSIHALQATPPEMLKAHIQLRSSQLEGAGLLCWLENMYGCAILADDMGVGKTFQLMALIFQNKPSEAERTTLLVVPAGAVAMWKSNLDRFTDISYLEYNTVNKDNLDVKDLAEFDIVLTTYNLIAKQYNNYAQRVWDIKAAVRGLTSRRIRIDGETVHRQLDTQRPWAPIYGMEFYRVILDEAHRIRNKGGGQFKAMSQLNTRRRIACSGTIFNNDYTDVGAILTFLRYQPWCNPSSFSRYFLKAKKKKAGGRGGARRGQLKHLRGAIFKYTLDGISVRRNKRDKFEGEEIIVVEKLDYQKIEHGLDDTIGTAFIIDEHGGTEQDTQKRTEILWRKQRSSDGQEDEDEEEEAKDPASAQLSHILFARLACISSLCTTAGYSNMGLESEMEVNIELDRWDFDGEESNIQHVRDASAFEKARNRVRRAARTEWSNSTKLKEAMSHIKQHLEQNIELMAPAKPHKIVVYCEYLSALDILEVGIQLAMPDNPILRIDGQSSSKSRNNAIKLFMQDPKHCIVLVTFNAGSEAIDLSSADYVLLLHPIWNPAQIQQCIGRAYRHGQERQVKARVLVAKSSIEQYVYRIQDQKRKKDLLLKTPVDAKTLEQVGSIQTQEEFVKKVLTSFPLVLGLLTMIQLEKIRVGKACDRVGAGISQATQDPTSDGNGTSNPQDGMQSEAEMMETTGEVPSDDNSSSEEDDSGAENSMIETEVVE